MQVLKELLVGVDATPTKDSAISKLKKLDSLLMEVESHDSIKLLRGKSCPLVSAFFKRNHIRGLVVAIVTHSVPAPLPIKHIPCRGSWFTPASHDRCCDKDFNFSRWDFRGRHWECAEDFERYEKIGYRDNIGSHGDIYLTDKYESIWLLLIVYYLKDFY